MPQDIPDVDDQSVSNAPPDPTQQTAPDPSQTPASPAAQTATVAPVAPSQPSPASQPSQGVVSNFPVPGAPTTDPNASHPSVVRAGVMQSIARALAGNPTTVAIDPTTGATTRTPAPVSGRTLALSIALEALSGGITGLAQHGPNHEAAAAEAGFSEGKQQVQAAQQAAEQQASVDYARQAAITNTNFQTHANAVRLGQMEYDSHQQYVADAAPILDNLQQVGAIVASGVSEGDVVNKYHVAKNLAIVDGVVPRLNADGSQATNTDGSKAWDNTYSVVDPNAKIALPTATAQMLADYRTPGYYRMVDGKPQPIDIPTGTPIAARLVVAGMATASAIKITESSINSQLAALPNGGDAAAKFEVNLKSSLASGDVTPKALQVYSRYSGEPLDLAFTSMQKDKVDPSVIGQLASLIPADARDQMKQQRTDAAKYSIIDSTDKAQAVLAAPKRFTPAQVSAATNFTRIAKSDSVSKATEDARARAVATGADVEAMLKTGLNPITGEKLTLANAPDSMLVDPNGNVIPQNQQSLYKPTSQQRQTADTARQVLAISSDLQAQIAKTPGLIGPLSGNSAKAFAPFGIGTEAGQKMLDNVSLLQSAVTKMHTGRFSSEILKKSGSLVFPGMNVQQFAGAMDSLKDVAGRYADEDQLTTVANFRAKQTPQTPAVNPAEKPVVVNGKVIGYSVDGKTISRLAQ
jgi:hypothetical protein